MELRETKQYVISIVGSTRYQYLLRTANDANVILNVIVCNLTIYFRTKKLLIIIEETLDKCDGEYEIYFCNDHDSGLEEGVDLDNMSIISSGKLIYA